MIDKWSDKSKQLITAYVDFIVPIQNDNIQMSKVVCAYYDGKCSYKFESQPVINSNLNIIQGDPVQIIVDSEDYSNYKILLERSDGLNDKKKDADKSTESTRNQSKYVVSFVLCMLVILFQSISMCIAVSLHGMKEIMGYLPLILIWLFLAFEMKKKNL